MRISVVIVNYNVKYFLGQCLASLQQSSCAEQLEIIVVDNASQDGSDVYVQQHFPQVRWMGLEKNVGFSRANNGGVAAATGDHVLILNPDTIVDAKAIERCRDYLIAHEDTGMIGARMRDGSGQYLPESKRGLPSAMSAFFKFSKLSRLFPTSARVNHYYMGHLPVDETNEVDVLTGAFMYMHRSTYLSVGGFDEDYFMYGEDIDLSYRVQASGRKNIYLPAAEIIHFKGESTRKSSVDYVKRFYEAMLIFAKKHGKGQWAFRLGVRLAILTKGALALVQQTVRRLWPVLVDAIILLLSFIGVTELWELGVKGEDFYATERVLKNSALYLLILLLVLLYSGKYLRRLTSLQYARAAITGVVILLAVYSLLPTSIRYSRAILLIGSGIGLAAIGLIARMRSVRQQRTGDQQRRIAIVGMDQHMHGLLDLLERRDGGRLIGHVVPEEGDQEGQHVLGDLSVVEDVVRFHEIDELIFDQRTISLRQIMEAMTQLDGACSCRLYSDEAKSIVSSYSSTLRGEVETQDIVYKLSSPYGRFLKRSVDVAACLGLMLILWPLWSRRTDRPMSEWLSVLMGRASWIGYLYPDANGELLPHHQPAIWPHTQVDASLHDEQRIILDFIYAREYAPMMDLRALYHHLSAC